jgi:hypothetical protein
MSKKLQVLVGVILAVMVFPSCNREGNDSAKRALKALRKVEAATDVGAKYGAYAILVLRTQDEVNESKAKLPDGDLKTLISETMSLYSNTARLWGTQLGNGQMDDEDANQIQKGWQQASHNIKVISRLVGE